MACARDACARDTWAYNVWGCNAWVHTWVLMVMYVRVFDAWAYAATLTMKKHWCMHRIIHKCVFMVKVDGQRQVQVHG
jgi:hypothetical protein